MASAFVYQSDLVLVPAARDIAFASTQLLLRAPGHDEQQLHGKSNHRLTCSFGDDVDRYAIASQVGKAKNSDHISGLH